MIAGLSRSDDDARPSWRRSSGSAMNPSRDACEAMRSARRAPASRWVAGGTGGREGDEVDSGTSSEQLRRVNYEIAEAIAPGWERRRSDVERFAQPVRAWMLREANPRPGEVVLELAAGVGETGFDAAALVGESGRVITSDFSPAMLDAARRRGDARGLANVEYRLVDGECMDVESATVDAVLCRFGLMLMVDPDAALAESRRILRPGGRLALAVWAAPERNPYFTAVVGALVSAGHLPPPDAGGPGIFALADPGRLAAMLGRAGFGGVRTEEVSVRFRVPDIGEYLSLVADTAGPIGLTLQALAPADRAAARARTGAALRGFRGLNGLDIPGAALCAIARV
jgi:SAM-dependent methyltransferase